MQAGARSGLRKTTGRVLRATGALGLGIGLVLTSSSTASAGLPNPAWPGECPQRIVLVLDRSESMEEQEDDVHDAAEDLVDAFRGEPNNVGLVSFGTTAHVDREPGPVDEQQNRRQLKDEINDLTTLSDEKGLTNWEAALLEAGSLQPDLVVLLTDGLPTVHGTPPVFPETENDPAPFQAAVAAADRLKGAGTRVVAVQIGAYAEAEPNLAAVTGPQAGDDYYVTGVADLVSVLYDVAGKACAVPVADLPRPEPRPFPILPWLGGGGLLVAASAVGGLMLSRRRNETASSAGTAVRAARQSALRDPTIGFDDLDVPEPPSNDLQRGIDIGLPPEEVQTAPEAPPTAPRPPRRALTDRIKDYRPPTSDSD